jgi:lipopolysaccharide/colanic/teichoic acid biosynthesis glycosyltransferase
MESSALATILPFEANQNHLATYGTSMSHCRILHFPAITNGQENCLRISGQSQAQNSEFVQSPIITARIWLGVKRVSDVCAVLLSAPIWVPITMMCIGLVWLTDRKNPFSLQKRIGKNGHVFNMFKLRTMVSHAENVLQKHLRENTVLLQEWKFGCKLRNDPSVTYIGKFLHRFSLDELPQLLNVLIGEMSIVGPRPLPVYHHKTLRHDVVKDREPVRPGFIGLWQIICR